MVLAGGVDYETMTEQRKGCENRNLLGDVVQPGKKGAQRRKPKNTLWNPDPYLQTRWHPVPQSTPDAGLRYSTLSFDPSGYYITQNNDGDSGSARYHKLPPLGALNYALSALCNLHLPTGRGCETPAIHDLSYRSINGSITGLNRGLKPVTSGSVELGSKPRIGYRLLSAALFLTDSDNERVVVQNQFVRDWRVNWPRRCRMPPVAIKTAMREASAPLRPGAWRILCTIRALLQYAPQSGGHAGADIRYLLNIQVNNANDAQAPSYTVASLNGGWRLNWNRWLLDRFSRVDNLFDRQPIGPVIVNASSNRCCEPPLGRCCHHDLSVLIFSPDPLRQRIQQVSARDACVSKAVTLLDG